MTIEPYWWWLIGGLILAIAELVAPGIYLIWLGGAAILTGVLTLASGIAPIGQALLFAALAVILVLAARRWFVELPIESSDPLLNDRAGRLIGQEVTVIEPIRGGRGRVRVGDGAWPARGPDAPAGARVQVTGADGACLLVGPLAIGTDDDQT